MTTILQVQFPLGEVSRHPMGAKRKRRPSRVALVALANPPSAIRYLEDPVHAPSCPGRRGCSSVNWRGHPRFTFLQ